MKNFSSILYLFTIIMMITSSTCHSNPHASIVMTQTNDEVNLLCSKEQFNHDLKKICNSYTQLQQNYELLNKNYTNLINENELRAKWTTEYMFKHPATTAIVVFMFSTLGIIEEYIFTFNIILTFMLLWKIYKN
jgi:hypothetical protein